MDICFAMYVLYLCCWAVPQQYPQAHSGRLVTVAVGRCVQAGSALQHVAVLSAACAAASWSLLCCVQNALHSAKYMQSMRRVQSTLFMSVYGHKSVQHGNRRCPALCIAYVAVAVVRVYSLLIGHTCMQIMLGHSCASAALS